MKSQSLLIYDLEVHIYIGFLDLKVKGTQCGICSQAAFKNARVMFFFEVGRVGHQFFGWVKIFPGRLPSPESDPSPSS